MDTLIVLGTGSAWIYSMVVILYPELLPIGSRYHFFEAALFVIGFVNLGKALEMNARYQGVSRDTKTIRPDTPVRHTS